MGKWMCEYDWIFFICYVRCYVSDIEMIFVGVGVKELLIINSNCVRYYYIDILID